MDEEKIRDITTEIFDKLMYEDEEVADKFDDMMDFVEYVLEHKKAPLSLVDRCGLTDTEFGMAMMTIKKRLEEKTMSKDLFNRIYEGNIKYGGEFPGDNSTDHIKKGKEQKAIVNGKPNFKYDEKSKWGPIPRTGVGRKEYNVKYSKSGGLIESGIVDPKDMDLLQESDDGPNPLDQADWDHFDDCCNICGSIDHYDNECSENEKDSLGDNGRGFNDGEVCEYCNEVVDEGYCGCGWERSDAAYYDPEENREEDFDEMVGSGRWGEDEELDEDMPIYTKSGRLIERAVKGVISPALKEHVKEQENKKHLLENRIINKRDLDLLEESEKCSKCGAAQTKKNADYSCWGDGICPKCARRVKESYEGDTDTFRPEAEQLADELNMDVDNVLKIMNRASSAEEAADLLCDEYQLDMADADVVYDILGIEGERNRDHLDDFDLSKDEYNEYLSDKRKI